MTTACLRRLKWLAAIWIFCTPVWAESPALAAPRIPFKHEAVSPGTDLSHVAGGLLVVLLAAAGGLYWARKRLGFMPSAASATMLQIHETRRLTPKISLHIIEFAGTRHLLACTENSVQTIASIAPPQQ